MVLFIIKERVDFCNSLKYGRPKDKILLIQDGVLMLHNANNSLLELAKEKNIEVLALKQDLELRGIKNNAKAKLADYSCVVELIEKNRVFS